MTKKLSYVMLEPHNMRMEPSNVKKKKKVKEPSNVRKELLYVMLEPHNVMMEPLSVRKR